MEQETENEIEKQTTSEVFQLEQDLAIKMQLDVEKNASNRDSIEYKVNFLLECPEGKKVQMHWGVYKMAKKRDWVAPDASIYPPSTKGCDTQSADTDFVDGKIKMDLTLKSDKATFGGINWVFHDLLTNKWYNNNNSNYVAEFIVPEKAKGPTGLVIPSCIEEVISCEGGDGSWCLMMRYNKCCWALNQLNFNNSEEALWIYLWLRMSFKRLLTWQRKYNTPPRELQSSMHNITFEITKKFAEQASKKQSSKTFQISSAAYLEDALVMCGKGRSNGQRIRDDILVIFHKNGINERVDSFYEQWHQKLHNNTTPDDIIICQALLNFLKTNNMGEYHNTLKNGGVTKEMLLSYDRKIDKEPYYAPQYIPDFESFLWLLKDVHASVDLVTNFEQAKYALNNNGLFNEIIHFKDDWDTLKQIWRVTNGREELQKIIKGSLNEHGKLRDLLFFDSTLLIYLRQLVEKIIHIQLEFGLYVNEISAIMKNIINANNCYDEIQYIYEDWQMISEKLKGDINTPITAMKIKSVTDRMSRLLGSVTDYYNTVFEPRAKYFGYGCDIDKYHVDLFTEEEIRGGIFFALSVLLKKIEPILRQKANLGPWKIISRGSQNESIGIVRHEKNLQTVQMDVFKEKTILLCDNVGGNEEVPVNCIGIIIINSATYPDMLAHVSVRARNLMIPLVVCFDDEIGTKLKALNGKNMKIKFSGQNLEYEQVSQPVDNSVKDSQEGELVNKINAVQVSSEFTKVFIELDEFSKEYVGAKANNTLKVFGKLPEWIKYPESFAIPFNVCEYFCSLEENKSVEDKLEELQNKIIKEKEMKVISSLLEQCKKVMMTLKFPSNNEQTVKLTERLVKFGISKDKIEPALMAVKSVWASKFNERAYIATSKVGITLKSIRMAVLCQTIIASEYAFVIHTKNPSNNDDNEVYSEVVYGMGETLVGSYDGQAFSFVYNKKTKESTIKSYPNKSIALINSGFIFRSDSNTEDLEGFAGAGLFDSIPIVKDKEVPMVYHSNQLFSDASFGKEMMSKIGNLGIEVEKMYNGAPQDIEGVYAKGQFYIVQTRPQV